MILVLLVWGVGIEPRLLDVKSYHVSYLKNLPQNLKGTKIAFFADLQVGMWWGNEGTAKEVVRQLIEDNPDLILIGGDFIYHPIEDDSKKEAKSEFDQEEHLEVGNQIKRVLDILRPLASSGIPTFAVLGNHDYAMETPGVLKVEKVAAKLRDGLEQIGIRVLHNESAKVILDKDSAEASSIYVVGVGPHYPNEDNIIKALSSVPSEAPRVVFMHNAQSYRKAPPGSAPLAMAGHTHGGQIRIPFLDSWSWIKIMKPYELHADGWIKDFGAEGNHLYINRGIGFSRLPIRINCRPELTYINLENSQEKQDAQRRASSQR